MRGRTEPPADGSKADIFQEVRMKGKFHPAKHDDLVVEIVPQVGLTDGEFNLHIVEHLFHPEYPGF